VPVKTIAEFIACAKANLGKLNMASAGRISDAGDQSAGQRRTDARDLIQPLARLARSVPGHDLAIEVQNLCL
jgi:hypothetical protein